MTISDTIPRSPVNTDHCTHAIATRKIFLLQV